MDIPTRYNPKETEDKWYKFWEENGFFIAHIDPKKKPYSIVIPPPNITGILHMGHALNNTIQDIIIRFKKMQGFSTLWLPGTDHAGIATQNVVERMLAQKGIKRQAIGREKFLEYVWDWNRQYGSTIINQLKKLGCSCDWTRTRFTMDEGLSEAVLEAFVILYKKNLIYRGNYIINWCPRCQTALSDEEAQHKELDGQLYYIKYLIKEKIPNSKSQISNKSQIPNPKSQKYIVVATTRPETMLGDVAVAINPKDKRYKWLIGQTVILPILNRDLKVIKDNFVDLKFGTGIVKVTPAHDPNDFEMANRHKLEAINIMNADGTLNANAGDYEGMDRFKAREAILEDLKERKLLEKTEPHKYSAGHCYRCHTIVEPYLSRQWFVKMKPLSKPAIEAVKKGKIKFFPKRWTKVYLNWMLNIKDWCISRQIWWGHRLPVYYCKKCQDEEKFQIPKSKIQINSKYKISNFKTASGIIVSKTKPEKCPECGSTELFQDEDVLDTWFSSWLWPFSTMGWPKKTADLDYFYPTSVLVTAPEILFFWVARMIMAGFEFMGKEPFTDVYIHGTVRDISGTKMSKSLGNIIDPLDIIAEYGADALRFSIVSITAIGQDVFLSKEKFELGRNFANKIWNVSRFVMMNLDKDKISPVRKDFSNGVNVDLCVFFQKENLTLADRWILSNFYATLEKVTKCLEAYKFNEAAGLLYEFIWHQFCDWYIEFSKNKLNQYATQVILYKVLEKSLRILHPFMPYITEEIWQMLPHQDKSIMVSTWPHIQRQMIDKKSEIDMQKILSLIVSIRNIRAEMDIPYTKEIEVLIQAKTKNTISLLEENLDNIKQLTRSNSIDIAKDIKKPAHSATAVIPDMDVYVPLSGVIDIDLEKNRLLKKIDSLQQNYNALVTRLKNKEFLTKAPKEIIKQDKQKRIELKQTLNRLKANIKDLS